MIVKTEFARISYYIERYDNNGMPDLSGNRRILNNETIYWFKSIDGYPIPFTSQDEINVLVKYLNSLPALFTNNLQISANSDEFLFSEDPLIFLNKFVVEITVCLLSFNVLGYRERIV